MKVSVLNRDFLFDRKPKRDYSPDGSGILAKQDIADSGSRVVEKRKCSAPKKEKSLRCGGRIYVESGRVELPSKQATKELSTRLFSDWIFDSMIGQKQPHTTYLLRFS